MAIERRSTDDKPNQALRQQVANMARLDGAQIEIVPWHHDACGLGLQAADGVAWSIGRKYNAPAEERLQYTSLIGNDAFIIEVGIDSEGRMQPTKDMRGD